MSVGSALPLHFGPVARPLFGWYHAPMAAAATREALVLCSPIGQEDINAHRTLRHLAQMAAEHGVPALRFDYDGCGDSCGDDFDPERLRAWIDSVHAAVEELRRRSGAERVCLLGVRMGALLAALAAAERDDASSLVAIAPVVSGRAFVREWKTLGIVREWRATGGERDTAEDRPVEAAGYAMTRLTRDDLSRIDLLQLPRVAREVLIIDRDDLPQRDRWSAHLAASGARVTHEVLPGYLGMMSEPHNVQLPNAIIERVLAWLARDDAAAVPAHVARAFPTGRPAQVDDAVRETPICVDDQGVQFAILSEPLAQNDAAPRRALILLNSGSGRHIGPNRMYVPLARHFAARGWTVLRADVSGLGDSQAHAGQPDNAPYTSQAQRDIGTWLALLHERGIEDCHLLGVCSGAYHGFKAAAAGFGLASVIPINPLVFFWRDGMPLDPPLSDPGVVRMAAVYRRSMFDREKWLKLMKGQVDVITPARVFTRRLWARSKVAVRRVARLLGTPLPDDLVVELRKVQAQGTSLGFIFASGDSGQTLLREQGGSMVERLAQRGQLNIWELPDTDHTFSTIRARAALLAQVEAHLLSMPATRVTAAAQVGPQKMASA